MKIIHVTSLNYKLSNGIKSVLQALVPEQQKLGNEVLVVNLTINDCKLFSDECFIRSISEFRLLIRDKEPDIVIFHGNYNPKYYQFSWFLKRVKIPYLIVPHGGTSLQNLKKNKLIKVIVNKLFTNRFVSKSKGLLFLNRQEHESSIYFGKAYYHIIPNGVHVNQFKPENKKRDSIVHFFYLSRIDFQHKGLDLLLQGIELFTQSNPGLLCDFSFYGGRFDPVFVDKFKDMISNMHTPVKYYGEVLGKEKEEAYLGGNIYMLTSRYEGMPLTVLEALSYGNPCIITPQTNMGELISDNCCGWIADTNADSIAKVLELAYREYLADRNGYISRSVSAIHPYTWQEIAKKSLQVYKDVLKSENDS